MVPSRYSKGKGAVLYATKSIDKFYIVLHNISGKDQRIWRDWCSWGYENLSLSAKLADGRVVSLTKTAKKWTKNYPDAALVPEGESYVFEVHLSGKTCQGVKDFPKESCKLSITYQIQKSAEATEKKVWVGKVVSKPLTVSVRQ